MKSYATVALMGAVGFSVFLATWGPTNQMIQSSSANHPSVINPDRRTSLEKEVTRRTIPVIKTSEEKGILTQWGRVTEEDAWWLRSAEYRRTTRIVTSPAYMPPSSAGRLDGRDDPNNPDFRSNLSRASGKR